MILNIRCCLNATFNHFNFEMQIMVRHVQVDLVSPAKQCSIDEIETILNSKIRFATKPNVTWRKPAVYNIDKFHIK